MSALENFPRWPRKLGRNFRKFEPGSATYLAALQEIIGSEAVTNVYAASYFHDKTTHELSSRLICFSKKLEEMFLARREFNKSNGSLNKKFELGKIEIHLFKFNPTKLIKFPKNSHYFPFISCWIRDRIILLEIFIVNLALIGNEEIYVTVQTSNPNSITIASPLNPLRLKLKLLKYRHVRANSKRSTRPTP